MESRNINIGADSTNSDMVVDYLNDREIEFDTFHFEYDDCVNVDTNFTADEYTEMVYLINFLDHNGIYFESETFL